MIALDDGTRAVLDDIELPLVAVLAEMELTGVSIDTAVLRRLRGELTDKANDYAARAYAEIGHELNLGSPKQLQQVLFDELGMPKTRSTKTGYSTDAAVARRPAGEQPAPVPRPAAAAPRRDEAQADRRDAGARPSPPTTASTRRTTRPGTSTGRISSNDPNLQNIPIRTEEGREIRSAFRSADDYETLLTADYSQIEMRIMAHLSEDPGLIEAFNAGEDLHRFVGARVFGVAPDDVTPLMRTKVKAMSYGLAYGLSPFGLSKQLRIETSRGASI